MPPLTIAVLLALAADRTARGSEKCYHPEKNCPSFCCANKEKMEGHQHCCNLCTDSVYKFSRNTIPCKVGVNVGPLVGKVLSGTMVISSVALLLVLAALGNCVWQRILLWQRKPQSATRFTWRVRSPRGTFRDSSVDSSFTYPVPEQSRRFGVRSVASVVSSAGTELDYYKSRSRDNSFDTRTFSSDSDLYSTSQEMKYPDSLTEFDKGGRRGISKNEKVRFAPNI